MRVLIIHRYYWPDKSPDAVIMHSIAQHLAANNHQVDVLSAQPSYRRSSLLNKCPSKEVMNRVNINRLSLPYEIRQPLWRVFNAFHLGVRTLIKALSRKYDVIITATVPPVISGLFSTLAAKLTRARFIYYCMDLHPEVGRLSGDFANPILFNMLQRIDDWSCRQASPVLVHSSDMLKTLRARPRGNEYHIQIMNNFAPLSQGALVNLAKFDLGTSKNRLTLIYAGNIGRFQNLESVIDAMGLIADRKDIELILMGEGVMKSALIHRAFEVNANIRFFDHQPAEIAKQAIRQADIGLVTLIREMYKYAYPSKIMAYLEQGTPIIAAVEPESELSQEMQSHGYGFPVPIDDINALAKLLLRLADDNRWKRKMYKSALDAFEQNFSAKVILERWSCVVEPGSVV